MRRAIKKRNNIIAFLALIISLTITHSEIISNISSMINGIFPIAMSICKSNPTICDTFSKSIIASTASSTLVIPKKDSLRTERSKWEIIHDMLKVLTEDTKPRKTRIMQRACLDWRNFQRYFNFLSEENFIAECNNPKEGRYELTDSGYELLKRLKNVDEILNSQMQKF